MQAITSSCGSLIVAFLGADARRVDVSAAAEWATRLDKQGSMQLRFLEESYAFMLAQAGNEAEGFVAEQFRSAESPLLFSVSFKFN